MQSQIFVCPSVLEFDIVWPNEVKLALNKGKLADILSDLPIGQ